MTWRARWRSWWRRKLHEAKVRAKGARAGWRDPQPVLRPFWEPRMTSGTRWNYDLLFQQNRSVLGVFVEVDNELLRKPEIAAASIANKARMMAKYAAELEVERVANR